MQAFGFFSNSSWFFYLDLMTFFNSSWCFFFPHCLTMFSQRQLRLGYQVSCCLRAPSQGTSGFFLLICMLFFLCHNCVCLVPLHMPFYTCSMQCYFILLYVDFFSFSWISFLLCLLFCTPNLCLVLSLFSCFFSMLYAFLLSLLLSLIFHSQPLLCIWFFVSDKITTWCVASISWSLICLLTWLV